MNFLVDESVDLVIAHQLRRDGHSVDCVAESSPGIRDEVILQRASSSEVVLLTADLDFGDLIYRCGYAHHGVLLLRLHGLAPPSKAYRVSEVVREHNENLYGVFGVISRGSFRIRLEF